MEDFGHIKAAKGHTETHFEYERCSRRESGRGGEGGGEQQGSNGVSGRIKAEDGGRVLSPAVQLR